MNRKEKGWMAEACVKAYYDGLSNSLLETGWNLSPQEPAADLLYSGYKLVIEVKFGRTPTRLKPDEKIQIAWRALWCAERGYHYRLWHTDRKVPPSTGRCYTVLGLEAAPNRKGYRLRVYEEGQFDLPKPGVGQVTRFQGLPPLLPPLPLDHAESRAVNGEPGELVTGLVFPVKQAAPPAKPFRICNTGPGHFVSHPGNCACGLCEPCYDDSEPLPAQGAGG